MISLILWHLLYIHLIYVSRELWLCLRDTRNNLSLRDWVIWIDRLGNVICLGHFDNTISARTAWLANSSRTYYCMERYINWGFYRLDGPNHCWQAYRNELNEDNQVDFKRGGAMGRVLLWLVVLIPVLLVKLVTLPLTPPSRF